MNHILKLFYALAATAILAGSCPAWAQSVTPAATRNHGGAGVSGQFSVNTAGSTAVGGVIAVLVGFYNGSPPSSISVSDAKGDTFTQVITKSSNNNTAYGFVSPVTTASSSTEAVTTNFGSAVNYPWMIVIYMPAVGGYTYGGVDFSASSTSSTGTLTLSGTASQTHDVLMSVASSGETAIGSGQTTLFDSHSGTGDWSSWSQPSGSGSVSHTYTVGGGDTVGILVAEKITANGPSYAQCGSSLTPAFSNKLFIYQCQLNSNLVINNPTGLTSSGGDALMLELMQPTPEPQTPYTVTLGSMYWQVNSPASNMLTLSTVPGAFDDIPGFSMPAPLPGGAQHVTLGINPLLNMGQ